jgi:multiple sugar transport system ATP-binding protein
MGKIEQVGTYQSLKENPASLFVAGFLGLPPMDLFPGGSVSDGRLVLDEYSFPVAKDVLPFVHNGQGLTMGIRRESVGMAGHLTNGIRLRAQVEAFETDFVHRILIVFLRMGKFQFSGLCPVDRKISVGQMVEVEIDPAHLYFFDSRSGKRL